MSLLFEVMKNRVQETVDAEVQNGGDDPKKTDAFFEKCNHLASVIKMYHARGELTAEEVDKLAYIMGIGGMFDDWYERVANDSSKEG